MNLNKAELIGNLTKDPEIKTLPSGTNVASFAVATNHVWKDKQTGEKKQEAEYHNCIAFGKLSDVVGKYIRKGDKVYIDGRLKTRNWQDQAGNYKNKTEIIVQNLIMLGNRKGSEQSSEGEQPVPQSNEPEINVDDIPF